MYAIIQTGGKQYKVSKGDVIFVEKLDLQQDDTVNFDVVSVCTEENGLKFGSPFVSDANVTAKLLKNGKGKKITVFTYKPKKGEKRKMGHRQPYSQVLIDEISCNAKTTNSAKEND